MFIHSHLPSNASSCVSFLTLCLLLDPSNTKQPPKTQLNQIFIRCGHAELSFIRNAGAWMGGLFGLLQAIVYVFYDAHWVLPTVGFVVGTFTNWLALKMIFSPVQPVKCCGPSCCCREGCYMQGLFLKRQKQVSAEYGRTIAKEVLNAKNIIAAIISGPSTNTLFAIMYKHVKASMDKFAGGSHAQTLSTFRDEGKGTERQVAPAHACFIFVWVCVALGRSTGSCMQVWKEFTA